MKDPVREKIERYELTRTIDPTHFLSTVGAAVAAFAAVRGRLGPHRRQAAQLTPVVKWTGAHISILIGGVGGI